MEFERPLERTEWQGLKGRCISCGYLCQRSDLMSETVYEATVEARSYGNLVSHPESPRSTRIWCFVYQQPLYEEFMARTKRYGDTRDNAEISFEIITRDINCPKWCPYTPFLSPKEHLAKYDRSVHTEQTKQIIASNVAQTWVDLEKLATEPLYISFVGTTPEISTQISPQPPAGSTMVTKQQWINSVMNKTAAEGYEVDGYTVSVWPPGLQIHYKHKPQG